MNDLKISQETLGSYSLLAVDGEVDLATSPALAEAVDQQLREGLPVLLDLTEVGFLDSFGIRVLLGAAKTATALGTRLTLIPSEAVAHVLALTGVPREVLATVESREAAQRLLP